MADRYEYYITGDDGAAGVRRTSWEAQTFTPSVAHKITSVKLKLYRVGLPETLIVSIRATDDDGHPILPDLCSGSIDGDTLTTSTSGLWYEITLGAGSRLNADTKYAIVIRALDAPAYAYVYWRRDSSDPTYAGGCREYTGDSGDNWGSLPAHDLLFEDWGEVTWELHEWEGSDSIALTDTLVKNPIKVLADSIILTDVLVKNPIKVFTDAIKFTDVLEEVYIYVRTFTDGIAFTDSLVKSIAKVLTNGIAFTDTLIKLWVRRAIRILNAVRNLPSEREDEVER